MAYWSLIFSPHQWRAVLEQGATELEIPTRSRRLKELARRVRSDDAFACYVTTAGQWVAILQGRQAELVAGHLRLWTDPVAAVDLDVGLSTAEIRDRLSFLRHTKMVGFVRSPLRSLPLRDGDELLRLLSRARQGYNPRFEWPFQPVESVPAQASRLADAYDRLAPREAIETIVRMPHLNVSETEVQPGQRVVATFRLDVETPDDPGRYAPAVLERPSRHRSAEVGVWLAASPPFVVEDEEIRTVRVDPAEPRTESVTYALRATRDLPADVESASLIAVVTQKGRARGFVERAFEVVRMGVAWVLRPSPRRDAFAPFESVVGELEPDLTVFVRAVYAGFRDFKCLVRTPHISRYERGVEGDWHLPDRSRVVVERYMRDFTEAVTEFARRAALLGAGHELFRASPEVFKEVFWALVNGGTRIATIFVVSEEPHVPWELMVPNRVGSGGREHRQPLGVEFAIGRWTARPWGPPPTRLRIRRGLVVAPTNPCLQNGAAEATYVANLFNGTSLVPASIEQLDRVLESSSYDLLHFVCHGLTEQEIALQEVCLESNERLAPYFLQALSGVCTGLARDEPLVFLNACDVGRTNPSLVDAGGFPASLLNLRAGSVIAPLWSVTDATAFDLARDFYDTAVGDPTAPLGEIMARIRRRAYENHPFDDTFAAYAYYGDPLARLTTS